jgi:hypothetical protein
MGCRALRPPTAWYRASAQKAAKHFQRLNAEIVRVLSAPDTKAALFNQGLGCSAASTSQEFGAQMRSASTGEESCQERRNNSGLSDLPHDDQPGAVESLRTMQQVFSERSR